MGASCRGDMVLESVSPKVPTGLGSCATPGLQLSSRPELPHQTTEVACMRNRRKHRCRCTGFVLLLLGTVGVFGQTTQMSLSAQTDANPQSATSAPTTLTIADAL